MLSGVAHLSEFTLPWVGRASSGRAEWLSGLGVAREEGGGPLLTGGRHFQQNAAYSR